MFSVQSSRARSITLVICCTLLMLLSSAGQVTKEHVRAGQILVRYRSNVTPVGDPDVDKRHAPHVVPGLELVQVPSAKTAETLRDLRRRADVIYAEPNYIRS